MGKPLTQETKDKVSKSLRETYARRRKEANPTTLDKAKKAIRKELAELGVKIRVLQEKQAKLGEALSALDIVEK